MLNYNLCIKSFCFSVQQKLLLIKIDYFLCRSNMIYFVEIIPIISFYYSMMYPVCHLYEIHRKMYMAQPVNSSAFLNLKE